MGVDLLVTGIGDLCRMGAGTGAQAGSDQNDVGSVRDAALAVRDGLVVASGPRDAVVKFAGSARTTIDVEGATVLPGWVDAHTHLLFAATREDEFVMRLEGKTYQEIAAAGGGIHSSVRHFRQASDDEILEPVYHQFTIQVDNDRS